MANKYITPVPGAEIFIFEVPSLEAGKRIGTVYTGSILDVLQDDPLWPQIKTSWGQIGYVPKWMTQEFNQGPISQDLFYLSWPTDYKIMTQGFNLHPEWYGKYWPEGYKHLGHEGIDIQAPMNANIYACADGIVSQVIYSSTHNYGNHIRIKHLGGKFETIYAHLLTIDTAVGLEVRRKQYIGKADSTGNSTGSHLHLTLKKFGATANGETPFHNDIVDPMLYLVRD